MSVANRNGARRVADGGGDDARAELTEEASKDGCGVAQSLSLSPRCWQQMLILFGTHKPYQPVRSVELARQLDTESVHSLLSTTLMVGNAKAIDVSTSCQYTLLYNSANV